MDVATAEADLRYATLSKVTDAFIDGFGRRVRQHAVKRTVANLLKIMILQCCHSSSKARKAAFTSLDAIFAVFPVLLCDSSLLGGILESLTLLRDACDSEYDDEVSTPDLSLGMRL